MAGRRFHVLLALVLALCSTAISGCTMFAAGDDLSVQPASPSAPATSTPAPNATAATPTAVAPAVTPLTAGEALIYADDARVINVDPAAEYRVEHVTGSSSVPMSSLVSASKKWKKSGRILITSKRESVARSAANYLRKQGFKKVAYLVGGHESWNGDFSGSDPRATGGRAQLMLVYSSVPLLPDQSSVQRGFFVDRNKQILKKYKALEDKYSQDVDFDIINGSSDMSGVIRFIKLVQANPELKAWTTDEEDILPIWILVDRDGNVEAWAGVNTRAQVRVDGWLKAQSEWPNRPPQLPYPTR